METCSCPALKWWLPAVLTLAAPAFPADLPLRQIAEIRLNDRLAALGERPLEYPRVFSVSFSPDGNRLAIELVDAIDQYVLRTNRPSTGNAYLLVVPVAEPKTTVYFTDLSKLGPAGAVHADPVWAPDGNSLLFGAYWIHLPGGETCQNHAGPDAVSRSSMDSRVVFASGAELGGSGFLGPSALLSPVPRLTPRPGLQQPAPLPPTTFQIIDSQCRVREEWTTNRFLNVEAVSPDGRLLALLEGNLDREAPPINGLPADDQPLARAERISNQPQSLILTPPLAAAPYSEGQEVSRRAFPVESGRKIRVGQGGNTIFVNSAVCRMEQTPESELSMNYDGNVYIPRRVNWMAARLRCWDTQTGKEIRHTAPLWSLSVAPLSAGGGRIAIGDNGRSAGRSPTGIPAPPLHSIWDFNTGKVLAQWSPGADEAKDPGLGARLGFAISPDGRLVAEGGSGTVRIYRLLE